MKIAVRAPNWIGDAILSVPALESLHQNFPQAHIWIAAKEWVQSIYTSFEFIEGIVSLPDSDNFKSLKDSAQKIKKHNFDIGLLLTNSFSSALLFYLVNIPQRWGYIRDNRGLLLTKGVAVKKADNATHHQVHYYLNLISGLGLQTNSPELFLPLTSEGKKWGERELSSLSYNPENPLVILNPGAYYGPAKRWPASKFAELASILQEKKNAEILLVGSPNEVELAESIASSMIKKPMSMTGKTSLRQLSVLISFANLFVTNDTGPMHIANALRVPVVAIFGPTDPRVTGPFHLPSNVVKKDVSCWPCSYRKCPFDHRCMMRIEPMVIFQACQDFL